MPLQESAIRRCSRFVRLCRENADENIGAFYKVCAAGYRDCRANLGFQGAGKHAGHEIAGLQ